MSQTDELTRLAELHRNGDLTEEEFVAAKKKVIDSSGDENEKTFFKGDVPRPTPAPASKSSGAASGVAKGCGIGCLGLIVIFIIFMAVGNDDKKGGDNGSGVSNSSTLHDDLNNGKFDAYYDAQTIVSSYLKSPSSAEFPSYRDAIMTRNNDGSWSIYSSFEGTNSFGGKLQSHFRITMRKGADGWEAVAPPWIEDVN